MPPSSRAFGPFQAAQGAESGDSTDTVRGDTTRGMVALRDRSRQPYSRDGGCIAMIFITVKFKVRP